MSDVDTYKLNKIFTEKPPPLNAEEQAVLTQVKAVRTTPRDPRFPASNQAGHCYNRYNEWLVCMKSTGDEEGCRNMRYMALKICPYIWYEKWDEERDEGKFTGIKVDN